MAALEPTFVQMAFVFCVVVTGVVMWLGKEAANAAEKKTPPSVAFRRFQRLTYLPVYLVAMFSDWLQGPYVYALYESYGFTAGDNAILFIAGFGSSMIIGTVIGSMADRTGRRKAAMLYCVLYIVSCMTKHVSSYWVLMVGRATGGIATSLLFSVFESWLVCEHNARGFHPDLLGETFGMAIFGNSIVAILAGVVSQAAADFKELSPRAGPTPAYHVGGYLGPFDVSICCLLLTAALIQCSWTENYGQKGPDAEQGVATETAQQSVVLDIAEAVSVIFSNTEILLCGLVCSFFEASMFIFVFQWTPAVTEVDGPAPPYGHIFATFMVACMLGSRVYSTAVQFVSIEKLGVILMALAAACHMVPVFTKDPSTCFCAFLGFELTVGAYFPMMGTLKSKIVPEGLRSTIYNLYRVPLNFVVVSALLLKLNPAAAFSCTVLLLLIATCAQAMLCQIREASADYAPPGSSAPEAVEEAKPKQEIEFANVVGASAADGAEGPI